MALFRFLHRWPTLVPPDSELADSVPLLDDRDRDLEDYLALVCPIGKIDGYGGVSAPDGWLLCDGTAVSRTKYAALFTVIGTAYGTGDGSTTFNVPDLRNRLPKGALFPASLGGTADPTNSSHTHSVSGSTDSANATHNHTYHDDGGADNGTSNHDAAHSHGVTITSGSATPTITGSTALDVNFIIRY